MLDARQRLSTMRNLARETAEKSRVDSKVWYDKKARLRVYEPGDLVLALFSWPGKPLDTKWKGPYKVLERVGEVDYIITTPTKRKQTRLCHVNMLKSYTQRCYDNVNFDSCLVAEPSNDDEPDFGPSLEKDVPNFSFGNLDSTKRAELAQLLQSYSDIFSDQEKPLLLNTRLNFIQGLNPSNFLLIGQTPLRWRLLRRNLMPC